MVALSVLVAENSRKFCKKYFVLFVSPMKIRAGSISRGRLGAHASCVHPVSGNLVHAGSVRSQGSSPVSCAPATNSHSQWRAAGSWKLVVNSASPHSPQRHKEHKEFLRLKL